MFLAISVLYQAPDCHIKIADEVVATVIIFLTARPQHCDSHILGGHTQPYCHWSAGQCLTGEITDQHRQAAETLIASV